MESKVIKLKDTPLEEYTCLQVTDEQGDVSFVCEQVGYISSNDFKKDTELFNGFVQSVPDIVIDLMVYDKERDIYWIPASIYSKTPDGIGEFMIMPEMVEEFNDWGWVISIIKSVDTDWKDAKKYTFKKDEYMQAMKAVPTLV